MTTAELSKALNGIPRRTIHKYAKQLDAIKIGGRGGFRFPPQAVDWLRKILKEKMK